MPLFAKATGVYVDGVKVAHHSPLGSSAFVTGQVRRQITLEGGVIELDGSTYAALRHRFHNDGAEPTTLRRRHWRPVALGPAHGEGIAVGPPADIDATARSSSRCRRRS